MSTLRKGLSYHEYRKGARSTPCGRFYGDVDDGYPERGVLMDLTEDAAELERLEVRPCMVCIVGAPEQPVFGKGRPR